MLRQNRKVVLLLSIFALIIFPLVFLAARPALAADYQVLEKSATIQIESASFAIEHHMLKLKILTEEGANFREFQAVNGYIHIRNVTGSVALPDGRTLKIKDDHVMEVPISESADTLSDYKALVISPPSLEKGSVVHIEYDRQIKSLLYIDPWVYATSVPIGKASCTITFPTRSPVKYRGHDEAVTIRKSEAGGKTTLFFETENRKPLLMHGSSEHYSSVERKVVFLPEQCMIERWPLSTASWQSVGEWFSELSRFAYNSNPEMDSVAQQIAARYKDPSEIAEALYEYVQKNYAYTAVEVGIGGYKPRFALHTFQKKYGDCKDLTLLYLTLLKKAGVEGYPALVDTRSSKFFHRDFPSPTQFNHCIAYLPNVQNGTWVDSTVKNFRLGEVPVALQGKYALVAGGPNQLLQIPENFYESNVIRFHGAARESGDELEISGVVETRGESSGIIEHMKNALVKNLAQHYVYRNFLVPGLPVRRVEATYQSERVLSLRFATPVNRMKEHRLLLVNAMHYAAMDKASLDSRTEQFFALGNPVRMIVEIDFDLAGRTLVSKSLGHMMSGDYTKFRMEVREEQGKVKYLADAYFANGFLNAAEMEKYQKELRQIAAVLQRTIVIR